MKIKMVAEIDGKSYDVKYTGEEIKEIVHGKYRDFYSKDDIGGNNVRPGDSVMIIRFKDGETASFDSKWKMIIE